MNKYKFKWNMTEKQFGRMKDTLAKNCFDTKNVYGHCLIGKYDIELVFEQQAEIEPKILLNFYHLGVDSGYGYTESGQPYDYEDGTSISYESIKDLSFEDFKKKTETEIIKFFLHISVLEARKLNEQFLKKEVTCALADWR